MVTILLQAACFYTIPCLLVLASQKVSTEKFEKHEVKLSRDVLPSAFSIWSTLNREPLVESGFEPPNDISEEKLPDTEILNEKDTEGKPSCCSCGSGDSIAQKEEEVRAARLDMVTDILKDKLQLTSDESEWGDTDSDDTDVGVDAGLSKLPQEVLDQTLQDYSEPEDDDYYAWDKQTIEPGQNYVVDCPHVHNGGCYNFNLSDLQTHRDSIETSKLWLHTTLNHRFQHQPREIVVYDLLHHNTSTAGVSQNRLRIIAHSYPVARNSWFQVDLTELIQQYVQDGSLAISVAVACETCYRENRTEVLGEEDGFKPLLITNLLHKPARREKRSDDSNCNPYVECCKRPLVVDPDKIGLHSIHRPLSLSIGYCYGSCGSITTTSANHTVFKQWYRDHPHTPDGLKRNLQTCCVPTRLLPIDLIKVINGHHLVSTVPNAIVASCGCR